MDLEYVVRTIPIGEDWYPIVEGVDMLLTLPQAIAWIANEMAANGFRLHSHLTHMRPDGTGLEHILIFEKDHDDGN